MQMTLFYPLREKKEQDTLSTAFSLYLSDLVDFLSSASFSLRWHASHVERRVSDILLFPVEPGARTYTVSPRERMSKRKD